MSIREMNEGESEGDLIYRTTLLYDGRNRLQNFMESLPGDSHKTTYSYDRDNRATVIQYDDENHNVAYTYDGLGRLAERIVTNHNAEETDSEAGKYSTQYVYVDWKDEVDDKGNTTRYTTPLVESILQGEGTNRMDFAYTYDPCNNITSESRNGVVTTYGYDALGQLIRVNDPGDSFSGTHEFINGDLHFALQNCSIDGIVRMQNGKKVANLIIKDTYNFDDIRCATGITFSNIVNDAGFLAEAFTYGTPFSFEIYAMLELE